MGHDECLWRFATCRTRRLSARTEAIGVIPTGFRRMGSGPFGVGLTFAVQCAMATKPIPLLRQIVPRASASAASATAVKAGESGEFNLPSNDWIRSVPPRNIPEPWENFPPDKFEVGEQLGVGGMGVVYAATHRLTQRNVALKTLRTEYHNTVEAVERFIQEARVLTRVAGPGVVQLYDCAIGDQGVPYLVMERLDGVDLREWLDRRINRAMPADAVLRVGLEVARVLARVHSKGIVHRDIKPENIFLSHDAQGRLEVRLIDFGVAKLPSCNTRLTLVEHAVGSLLYISPEQLSDSREVTPASDVWSVGMLMTELLLGRHPYPSELSDAQLICRVLSEEPPRLHDHVRLPGPLEAVITRCLSKDSDSRYSHAGMLVEALMECARGIENTKSHEPDVARATRSDE